MAAQDHYSRGRRVRPANGPAGQRSLEALAVAEDREAWLARRRVFLTPVHPTDEGGQHHLVWPPSHGGRAPAARRLRSDGRRTRRRLLDAGRAVLAELGFHALRVDDVVQAAGTSHGTFYLYFSSKEDLLEVLVRDALRDMEAIVGAFPAVPPGDKGRRTLSTWVRRFCDTYAAHAVALRLLSQADAADQRLRRYGLRLLRQLAEAITQGMSNSGPPSGHAEFTALACAMMLERMNYLLSADVAIPAREMRERVTAIIAAAFSCGSDAVIIHRPEVISPNSAAAGP